MTPELLAELRAKIKGALHEHFGECAFVAVIETEDGTVIIGSKRTADAEFFRCVAQMMEENTPDESVTSSRSN